VKLFGGHSVSITLVVGGQNHLSLDEHVARLLDARTKIREGLWEIIDALKDALSAWGAKFHAHHCGYNRGEIIAPR
jgi:hypothetical protein